MTVEDLNKACNYVPDVTPTRIAFYPNGTTFSDGDTTEEYNGNVYTKVAHGYIRDGIPTFYACDGGGVEKTDSDGFKYRTPEENNPVYVTSTDYEYVPDSTISDMFGIDYNATWLASTNISLQYSSVYYKLMRVSSRWCDAYAMCYSNGSSASLTNPYRPVVSLGSTINVDTEDTSRDGSTAEKAWKLIKK